MPADRFFVDSTLVEGDNIVVEGQEFTHLTKAMRCGVGDTVEVVNGKGYLATATIDAVTKRHASLAIKSVEFFERPTPQVILAQAMPRLSRLDIILEKGTELGMSVLWLFHGDRSEKKSISDNQRRRITTGMVSAMKQCGRLWLPDVVEMPPISKWNGIDGTIFFGDIDPTAPLLSKAWEDRGDGDIIFAVGPESGFSDGEDKILRDLGAIGVKLHNNILRTDTASLMALSLISHFSMINDQ